MLDSSVLRRWAENTLGVPAKLHDYQWDGVAFLYRGRAALLADEMGLGKTVQAAVALALLLGTREDVNRALIVAPAALRLNWMSELGTWAPSLTVRELAGGRRDRWAFYALPVPVLVASYEQVREDGFDRIPADAFDVVILDEAQRIKNRDSATSLACRLLPRKYSWALSATPLENDVDDVLSILAFLEPFPGSEAGRPRLSTRLHRVMLRRRKKEVRGELPPVIVQDVRLELAGPQRERYNEVWSSRRDSVAGCEVDAIGLLGMITRLKIVCNLDRGTGASCKMDALETICAGAGPDARIIVFSQFVETLKWVSKRLPVPAAMLTGTMGSAARQDAMQRFRVGGTPRVLLVSLRAGGVGLNLGEATHVVMFDRWWNPAVENQAIYRAHRFERKEPLHVMRLTTVDTIEERIADILDKKTELFQDVVEAAETEAPSLSVPELLKILDIQAMGFPPS